MAIKWKWPGAIWAKNAAENAVESAAGAAVAVLTLSDSIMGVRWDLVGGAAALAALVSALKSVASLKVHNGTASVLADVIAKPRDSVPLP